VGKQLTYLRKLVILYLSETKEEEMEGNEGNETLEQKVTKLIDNKSVHAVLRAVSAYLIDRAREVESEEPALKDDYVIMADKVDEAVVLAEEYHM
jgi:hypothetical protein